MSSATKARERLYLYIVEGKGLDIKFGGYISVSLVDEKKSSFKTKTIKSDNPQWNEYFVFDFVPDKLSFATAYGSVTEQDLSKLQDELVTDKWVEFEPFKLKHQDRTKGKVHIRFLRTSQPFLRAEREGTEKVLYFYENWESKMKTGDLIIFSGRGAVHEALKLQSSSQFTHVGMVLVLPNRYTHRNSLFIMEVTSNADEIMDAFRDESNHGVNIFRLDERLHQFHGSGAWWVPLDPKTRVENTALIRYVSEVHGAQDIEETRMVPPLLNGNLVDFLRSEGISEKTPEVWADLWSTQLILVCLEKGGLINAQGQTTITPEEAETVTISQILRLPIFVQPNEYHILFCVESCKNYIGAADLKHRPETCDEGRMDRGVVPTQLGNFQSKKSMKGKAEKKPPKRKNPKRASVDFTGKSTKDIKKDRRKGVKSMTFPPLEFDSDMGSARTTNDSDNFTTLPPLTTTTTTTATLTTTVTTTNTNSTSVTSAMGVTQLHSSVGNSADKKVKPHHDDGSSDGMGSNGKGKKLKDKKKSLKTTALDDTGNTNGGGSLATANSSKNSSKASAGWSNDDIVLAAVNYWSRDTFHHVLKGKLDDAYITKIVDGRQQKGGVYWSLPELYTVLEDIVVAASKAPLPSTSATPGASFALSSVDSLMALIYTNIDMDHRVLSLVAPHVIPSCTVDPVTDGPNCLKQILKMIEGAQTYIHLSIMLFFNDDHGKKVLDALIARAKKGVEVRVIIDEAVMELDSPDNFHQMTKKMDKVGIQVILSKTSSYYYNSQWPDKRAGLKEKGVPEEFLILQDMAINLTSAFGDKRLTIVQHRKFMVVDGKTSWIGSINLGSEYIYNFPVKKYKDQKSSAKHGPTIPPEEEFWHDGLFILVGNECASVLNQMFASHWFTLGGDVFDYNSEKYSPSTDESKGTDKCALFTAFPGNPQNLIQEYFKEFLQGARDSIYIETPYVMDQEFWNVLQTLDPIKAQKLTVVTCLDINDHPEAARSVRVNVKTPFKEKGVQLYDYSGCERFSHWNVAVDTSTRTTFHGSYNLIPKDVTHYFECSLLVQSETVMENVVSKILLDMEVGRKATEEDLTVSEGGEDEGQATLFFC